MDVLSTNPNAFAGTSSASGQTSSSSSMDYDAFLTLLIAEMENQDPTNPMDASEYVAQFAAFANVEQTMQIGVKLDALLTSSALAQADAVIGHTVTSADGGISGTVVSLTIASGGEIVARLDNGEELVLGAGVTIS
jgi:flagellar basal-body rod modification protein FlgD